MHGGSGKKKQSIPGGLDRGRCGKQHECDARRAIEQSGLEAVGLGDLGQHGEWLHEYIEQSWDELYLHFVGKEQAGFIEAFGEKVLPKVKS